MEILLLLLISKVSSLAKQLNKITFGTRSSKLPASEAVIDETI